MFEWKELLSWHSWNKFFWLLFLVIGIVIISGAVLGLLSMVEVLVAFIVIAIGAEKLGEEISDKRLQEEQEKINRDLIFISKWLENNNMFTRQMKDKHETRLFNLDKKRAETDEKHEFSYRELAKKIFEIENRMNKLTHEMEKKGIAERRPEVFQTAKDLGLDLLPPPKAAPRPAPARPAPPKPAPKVKPAPKRRPKPRGPSFESVWRDVTGIAKKRKNISTLSKKSSNTIDSVSKSFIKMREGRNRKLITIRKGEFQSYWNVLSRKGVLNFVKDIKGRPLIRKGSLIISFLARLPSVEFTLRPRVLHLMPKNTHKLGTLKRRKW